MKAVYLEVSTLRGVSFGAVHFYGKLVCGQKVIELEHPLTRAQAEKLNKGEQGFSFLVYKPGDLYRGFDERQDVIDFGTESFKENFDESADLLVLGRAVYAEPQPVLIGPQELKDQVNAWHDEADKLGWHDGGHGRRVDEICNAFWAIAQKWEGEEEVE